MSNPPPSVFFSDLMVRQILQIVGIDICLVIVIWLIVSCFFQDTKRGVIVEQHPEAAGANLDVWKAKDAV